MYSIPSVRRRINKGSPVLNIFIREWERHTGLHFADDTFQNALDFYLQWLKDGRVPQFMRHTEL